MRGTCTERSPGVWRLRVDAGVDPVTGRRQRVSRTYRAPRSTPGAGRRGAEDALRALITEVTSGKHGGTTSTVDALLDAWIDHRRSLGRADKTIAGYRQKADAYVRPGLGPVTLAHLRPRDLDQLYGSLLAQGLSEQTILHIHRLISGALSQAERWGWIDRNPAQRATPPTVPHSEQDIPEPVDVRAIIDAARGSKDPELAAIFTAAALTGMRRGELCGLRWADVDFGSGEVNVRRSVYYHDGELRQKTPKSHQSRTIIMGDLGMAILRDRFGRATAEAEECETELGAGAYVWSTEVDGSVPVRPDRLTQALRRICDRLGLPAVHLHSLRHFAASQLIAAGTDVRTVAARLGHADASTTLRVYAHPLPERDRAAAGVLGALIDPP